MKIVKWKSISEWKPVALSLQQMLDLMASNIHSLPDDMRRRTIVVIKTTESGLLKSRQVEKAVYYDKKPLTTLEWLVNLEQNPHFKPFAEGVLRKITDMVSTSESTPVWVNDVFIFNIERSPIGYMWLFKGDIYLIDQLSDKREYSIEEVQLLILEYYDKDRRKWEQLKRKYQSDSIEDASYHRERIPEDVRIAVWRRDGGKCARCGSREKLEYDHIVPVSKGGSNTARNIELLCETCNRKKSNNIE